MKKQAPLANKIRCAWSGTDPLYIAYHDEEWGVPLHGIVRNRAKIESAIKNAKAFLDVQAEFGSFDAYQWRFVNGRPIQNRWRAVGGIPPRSAQSDAMSDDLKSRGFSFVGSTIIYAHMQAVGMVNDHLVNCFRHREVAQLGRGRHEARATV